MVLDPRFQVLSVPDCRFSRLRLCYATGSVLRRRYNTREPLAKRRCMLDDQKEFVLQTCRDHDVKFIRLWFTDILGSLKSFAITVEELEEALDEGKTFDGASIEGFARVDESD